MILPMSDSTNLRVNYSQTNSCHSCSSEYSIVMILETGPLKKEKKGVKGELAADGNGWLLTVMTSVTKKRNETE